MQPVQRWEVFTPGSKIKEFTSITHSRVAKPGANEDHTLELHGKHSSSKMALNKR